MNILFYDFETSGLPLFREPSSDPRQPHILQVAAVLVDASTRRVEAAIHLLVEPSGWGIDPQAAEVHGISMERALRYGVPEHVAVEALLSLWQTGTLRVGHVESFDARIMRIALKRFMPHTYHNPSGMHIADYWKLGASSCTAQMAQQVMGRKPKLSDAYAHFTGKQMEDAHDALADVMACMELYWALYSALGESL